MYRIFEIIPGSLIWLTFFLMILFSWLAPAATAVFIIIFDLYWLVRLIYLHLHLKFSFRELQKNLKIQWLEKIQNFPEWQNIYHLIILPMYEEPYELVRESFRALNQSNYPKKEKFIVVLATEEKGGQKSQKTAQKIKEEFENEFFKFFITVHPSNLPDEIPGKGSNETWAAQKAKENIIDASKIPYENILVTVLDIDAQVSKEYFGRLSYVFLTADHPQRSSYQPIPLFVNNIYDAPAFSRVMAFFPTFWQMMQQPRPEQLITFSSQSIPFKALVEINYWSKTNVSEDSIIFWQCYSHYDGDWRTVPLFYPVSMDATSAPTLWKTIVNLYKQQRRWGWGVENVPFMLNIFIKNKKIPLSKKIGWTIVFLEGFYSWATVPILTFVLGWLPLVLGGEIFRQTLISYNLPRITGLLMILLNIGIATSAIISTILLPPKPKWFKRRHYIIYLLQWVLTPLSLLIFSALPGIEAQTRLMLGGKFRLGFWPTPKNRANEQ